MTQTRKLAAILAADVVGYSRLAGADEDRTLARLRALRGDLIDPAIEADHGRVVKQTGDGVLIEFRSVVDAVRCAIEVQTGVVERNAGLPPERRIEFRVGIHLGDVVEESDGDLMGTASISRPGSKGSPRPARSACPRTPIVRSRAGSISQSPISARKQLKNIAEPIRVYSLEVGELAQAKPTEARADHKRPSAMLAAGIVAFIVIASGAGYFLSANRTATVVPTAAAPAGAARLSIVVLPFTNSRRPEPGLFRRRHHRKPHHRSVAHPQ